MKFIIIIIIIITIIYCGTVFPLQGMLSTPGGWTARGSNPSEDEIFHTRPDRPWGPSSLLYTVCKVSFPGVKRPGRGVDHPTTSSAEVKEKSRALLPLWAFMTCSRVNLPTPRCFPWWSVFPGNPDHRPPPPYIPND
jgi:hypothetical protein